MNESFMVDQNSIDTFEEIVYLLKLPQLKELSKMCHVTSKSSQNSIIRSEYIKLILNHFKSQQNDIKFYLKAKQTNNNDNKTNNNNSQFMKHCKKILGKCYKLNKMKRNVFVRILMLYSLSSTYQIDPNRKDDGQQALYFNLYFNFIRKEYFIFYFNELLISF